MEPTSTPPETAWQGRSDRGGRSFANALTSSHGMVAWYRRLLDRSGFRLLRRRAGRRWLTIAHLLSIAAIAGWASLEPSWPWPWLLYPVVMVVFFLLTGLLHAVTFGMIALRWRDLDERQRLIQGWAYRLANRITAGLFVAAIMSLFVVFGLQERVEIERTTTLAVVATFLIAVVWLPAYVLAFSRHVDDLDG